MQINEIISRELSRAASKQKIEVGGFLNKHLLVRTIKQDCSDFLSKAKGTAGVFRGIADYAGFPEAYQSQSRTRNARDTSQEIQKKFDELLISQGFSAVRGNSIFVSGSLPMAIGYGEPYFIIPKNGFTFTWSPEIKDFYTGGLALNNKSWAGFVSKWSISPDHNQLIHKINSIINPLIKDVNAIWSATVNRNSEPVLGVNWNQEFGKRWAMDSQWIESISRILNFIRESLKSPDLIWMFNDYGGKQLRQKLENSVNHFEAIKNIFAPRKDYQELLNLLSNQVSFDTPASEINTLEQAQRIIQNLGMKNNIDLHSAILSENEILINGSYYAFDYHKYQDLHDKLFSVKPG
jgi:hypothetical protein